MVALSLKISIGNVVKTMQFEPSTMVYDACRMIRERIPEALAGPRECDYPGGGGQESSIPYSVSALCSETLHLLSLCSSCSKVSSFFFFFVCLFCCCCF